MTPLREWLKPPRTLLLLLFLLAFVSVSALGWFGWKLQEQEQLVLAQRSQEQLEQAADRIAATIRGTLAETGEQLSAWESATTSRIPSYGGLLLLVKERSLVTTPANKLLYYPFASSEPEAASAAFAGPEFFEFAQAQPTEAVRSYERLANSGDSAVRAGALTRMARVLRNSGRVDESAAIYRRLAEISGVRVAGVPAELIARHALAELSGKPPDAIALRQELLRGRWHLTRGQFEFYWSEADRLSGSHEEPPAELRAFSEAVEHAWEAWQRNADVRGPETVWINGSAFFLISRGTHERRAVLVARPEAFFKKIFSDADPLYAIVDTEGRILAGRRSETRAAIRTSAESQLPWTLYVTAGRPMNQADLIPRQRFLLFGILVVVLFVVLGTYFIARAIGRETETLRMQSEFVSAVSHEFRSPLTSMRQLSEILALGRVPSEERRQLYYDTLVKESTRLQRLIETLLNFGKMEAGARQYRFEELDAALLIRRVVSEFEPQITGAGRHIEVHGLESECLIEADPDAICVALRNLLDNALKYSPDCPTVWVEWNVQNENVAIKVRDKGRGIAESERKAIFRKFVRGSAATATNVKGSGIGLAMVRHIVAAHGGEITVASEAGEGSAFTMLLPLAGRV